MLSSISCTINLKFVRYVYCTLLVTYDRMDDNDKKDMDTNSKRNYLCRRYHDRSSYFDKCIDTQVNDQSSAGDVTGAAKETAVQVRVRRVPEWSL